MTKPGAILSERAKEKKRAYSAAWRLANPDRAAKAKRDWYLRNCDRVKAKARALHRKNHVPKRVKIEDPVNHAKQWQRNYYARNRAKMIARASAHYRANPKQKYRKGREWIKANQAKVASYRRNRRAKIAGAAGKLSPGIIHILMAAQMGRCVYCSADLTGVRRELDHRMPLKLGGAHKDENMQLTCWKCNRRKGSKHPDMFQKELDDERKP